MTTPQIEADSSPPPGARKDCETDNPPEEDGRAERYQLQRVAQEILPEYRVAHCMQTRSQDYVGIWQTRYQKCHYTGVTTCGSIWHCPVCASQIATTRREEVQRAVDAHLAAGGAVAMLAFTVPHGPGEPLEPTIRRLQDALTRVKRGAPWKRFKARVGWMGDIQALEVTHGENGWHPHKHFIVFLERPVAEEEIWQWLQARWRTMALRAGLPEPHPVFGLDVQVRDARTIHGAEAGRYLTKGSWTEADEVTRAPSKTGRKGNFSPRDLLRLAADGDSRARMLFREYAEALHGRQHLIWSQGLKSYFGIEDQEDADLVEEEEWLMIAGLGPEAWRVIVREQAQFRVLKIAEQWGRRGVDQWLQERGVSGTLPPEVIEMPFIPPGLERDIREQVAPGPWV
jgi:hypothetical protein